MIKKLAVHFLKFKHSLPNPQTTINIIVFPLLKSTKIYKAENYAHTKQLSQRLLDLKLNFFFSSPLYMRRSIEIFIFIFIFFKSLTIISPSK